MTDIEQDIEGAIESREHLDAKIVHLEEENERLRAALQFSRAVLECCVNEKAKLRERLEAAERVNEVAQAVLNSSQERMERQTALDEENEQLRAKVAKKDDAAVIALEATIRRAEENERLRAEILDEASKACKYEGEWDVLRARIEAALAIKRVPGMGDDEFDRGWAAATDAFREALKGEGE